MFNQTWEDTQEGSQQKQKFINRKATLFKRQKLKTQEMEQTEGDCYSTVTMEQDDLAHESVCVGGATYKHRGRSKSNYITQNEKMYSCDILCI